MTGASTITDAKSLSTAIATHIATPLVQLMMAVSVFVFIYGLAEFMISLNGGGSNLEKGKSHMIWGIIGFVIMTASYAIIAMTLGTFGISFPPTQM